MSRLATWIRGVWLLRHPELVADLATRRLQLQELQTVAKQNPGARIGSQVRLLGHRPGSLALEAGSTVCDGSILSFGDEQNGRGRIQIGERTWIGQYNNLRAGGGDIRIGRECLVSQFCSLVAANHAHARGASIQSQGSESSPTGVVLADDVWLGAGCAVMPGVSIGRGAIVAANAVVTRSIPEFEIWGGVPARKIGERS